jgi:hypothetical protein
MKFRRISEILVDDESTWGADNGFLTFDIDWAHDEVISHTIDLVEKAGARATWFVTHESPVLERLRFNEKFEIGVHPNFNFLLDGDTSKGRTAEEIIDNVLEIVPEAKTVRSHSLVQGSRLTELFQNKGLTHESNIMIPDYSGSLVRPFVHGSGMNIIPYFWGDYLACSGTTEGKDVSRPTIDPDLPLRVFDFHPIHVFLNSESVSRYARARGLFADPPAMSAYRYEGFGAGEYLIELLDMET